MIADHYKAKVNFQLAEKEGGRVYSYHLKSLKKYMAEYESQGRISRVELWLSHHCQLILLDDGVYFIACWEHEKNIPPFIVFTKA